MRNLIIRNGSFVVKKFALICCFFLVTTLYQIFNQQQILKLRSGVLNSNDIFLSAGAAIDNNFDLLSFDNDTDKSQQNEPQDKCFSWGDKSADKWWEMNPEYEVTIENDNEFCFTVMQNNQKVSFFKKLHTHQYNVTKCSDTYTKRMISSGWGADISHVAAGLLHGLETDRPFQIVHEDYWHYSALKPRWRDGKSPVCPSGDLFCYFLPIGVCNATTVDPLNTRPQGAFLPWAREYATRPQQWLRHEVYKYMSHHAPTIHLPCAAIHVRRADVVLHGKFSRKYFPISDYIKLLNVNMKDKNYTNILLFTDDQNAIEEATTLHPEYNWMYLNRTRHRGSSGGFENQIPSGSPKDEVVLILVTFRLAQQCDVLVHTTSSFATAIHVSMLETGRDITRLQIDSDYRGRLHVNNSNTEIELEDYIKQHMLKKEEKQTVTSENSTDY